MFQLLETPSVRKLAEKMVSSEFNNKTFLIKFAFQLTFNVVSHFGLIV